jgi:predicted RNA-binding Zn-ribbon protein involved in translation (DUF1610 family)
MKRIKILLFLTLLISLSFSVQTYIYDNFHQITNNYKVLLQTQCEKAQKETGAIFQIIVTNHTQEPYLFLLKKYDSFSEKQNSIFILLDIQDHILRTISSPNYTNIINTNRAFNSELWADRQFSNFLYYYVESLMQDIYESKGLKFTPLRQTLSVQYSNQFGTLVVLALLIGGGGFFYHRLTHDIHKCPNCKSNMTMVYKTKKILNSKKVYEIKFKCDKCGYEYVKIKRR